MRKTFVLRTGAIIASSDTTLRFGSDNTIVIPLAVLQHLHTYDGIPEKKSIAANFLDYISSIPREKLMSREGFKQSNGSYLRVVDNTEPLDERIVSMVDFTRMDKRVYQVCLDLKNEGNPNVVLISKNPPIRLKAAVIGVDADTFKDELFPKPDEQYKGYVSTFTPQEIVDKMYKEKSIPKELIYDNDQIEWVENLFLDIKTEKSSVIGRYSDGRVYPLIFSKKLPNGYRALNIEQNMFWECLLAPPEIAPLVVAKGAAGTGKTFCALAFALEYLKKYSDNELYDQILVATPIVTVSNEAIGFLPGDIDEKVGPYLGGIMDNLKAIFREKDPDASNKDLTDRAVELFDRNYIQVQPIGFLRGRTIPNTVFIIDETQNIEPSVIKDIVTRSAKGSKFIFLGDPTQVNNPKLSERYNGLVYLSEKMKVSKRCWQITLSKKKSVRSELAQEALEIL